MSRTSSATVAPSKHPSVRSRPTTAPAAGSTPQMLWKMLRTAFCTARGWLGLLARKAKEARSNRG
eukprot:6554721-Alexandrium_andersonii.AAC.1